jgi:lipoyl(octanoyl) transferase
VNALINNNTGFIDLGLIDYKKAWDYQVLLFDKTLAVKTANRNLTVDKQQPTDNYLVFCEHPHVYTLGKTGKEENLLIPKEELHTINATYYQINRGGDITYHGPGQIVGYPILDLENFFTDIHRYMRSLEEAVILTLADYNVQAGRIEGLTGVWINEENPGSAKKICALGVKTSRWVTMHGFAFNVNCDLTYFDHIVPCGIADKGVKSLEREFGRTVDFDEVNSKLMHHISNVFKMKLFAYDGDLVKSLES